MMSHNVTKTIPGISCEVCGSSDIATLYRKQDIVCHLDLLRCKTCGLTFLAPEKERYSEETTYWDSSKQQKIYTDAEIEHNFESDFSHKLKLISKLQEKGNILDIGCGTGQFLNIARADGWDVYGLDISGEAAKIAREKYGLTVFVSRPEEFDSYGVMFNCITMWDAIEHMKNPTEVLRAIHSKLAPGGLLVIRTPNENALVRSIARALSAAGIKSFLKYVYYSPHYFYFNRRTLKKILIESGYKIVGIILENTDLAFASEKIAAHYKTKDKLIARFFLPFILFLSGLLHQQNKIVVFARKIS